MEKHAHNNTVVRSENAWKRALCYAGATVAGPVIAAALLPTAAAVVIAPLAVALPFFTMTLLEADLTGHACA